MHSLSGLQWFCALNVASGYWKVQMAEGHKEKRAFSTGSGMYHFNVMPFGLYNALATFKRLMEWVLVSLPWKVLFIFLDNVIVLTRSFEEVVRCL